MEIISIIKEVSNPGLSMFIAVYFIIRLDKFMGKILFELKEIKHCHKNEKEGEV